MCGIILLIDDDDKGVELIKHRGPDEINEHIIKNYRYRIYLGFARLRINGMDDNSSQPFYYKNTVLACNGEIYNHTDFNEYRISDSDCGILSKLFYKNGFNTETLLSLDGEFAIVYIIDNRYIYAARDRYGVRPLFIGYKNGIPSFASEMKALKNYDHVEQVLPNIYYVYDILTGQLDVNIYYNYIYTPIIIFDQVTAKNLLINAVEKRLQSDANIGFLLSGGFDSSIIVYIATEILGPDKMTCFTIGVENSPDVIAAKQLTKYLGIKNHHIVNFDLDKAIERLEEVVKAIETYDITTIRASTPQYILAEYIKNNTDVKVLLSGEGSDEIHGSYKYFKNAPTPMDSYNERIQLLKELCYFDNLRTDRTMAAFGLEVRCPFLDHRYVDYIMCIEPNEFTFSNITIEKLCIRKLFANKIPNDLLYRRKDAFSDSVSSQSNNWRNKIISTLKDEENIYIYWYSKYYNNCLNPMPRYWLPKWSGNISDPSATLI
jgi:asparagine synthase (glutamine-hydrolysing)